MSTFRRTLELLLRPRLSFWNVSSSFNNRPHIFSEVLRLPMHSKSICPEARGNWLCCHRSVFLVLQRGISYSGFETHSPPSPVGEKYGLSRANVIHVVGNEQAFFFSSSPKSVTPAALSLRVVLPPRLLLRAIALCSVSGNTVLVFQAPRSCSKNDISSSFSVDRGGKKKSVFCVFSRHTAPKWGCD